MGTSGFDHKVASGLIAMFVLTNLAAQLVAASTVHVSNSGSTTLCAYYWVPAPVKCGCSQLASGKSWNVAASGWQGATFWTVAGNCPGSCSCGGPPSGVTQFELTLQGSGGYDYYDVSSAAGCNVDVFVQPSNSNCDTVYCGCDAGGSVSADVHTCASGTTNYNVLFQT